MRLRYHFATWLTVMAVRPGLLTAKPLTPLIPRPSSVVIVELFTSEGCSSCPPADSLLRQVHLKETSAGQLIVGISEHVTYWNNLGWKDPYSSQVFTDRQSLYASRLSPDGPYTPQMVVDGREQFVGSDGGTLGRALADAGRRAHVDLRILSSTPSDSVLDVRFAVSGSFSKALDIVAVFADDADRSNVLRGENNGRLLEHVSVARTLNVAATIRDSGEESFRLALPDGFQSGTAGGHHPILFAQEPHQGTILGAATIPL